jgi:hypothetical protein
MEGYFEFSQLNEASWIFVEPKGEKPRLQCTLEYKKMDMRKRRLFVVKMRLSRDGEERLNRMARHHGWTPSDTSARLVEEGLRRSEFAFIDFRDSPVGRQAYIQGSTLAVWEIMLLLRSYKADTSAVARHLRWAEGKVQAAANYAAAFPEEINEAMTENDFSDFEILKRMLPQAAEFVPKKAVKSQRAQARIGVHPRNPR